MSAAEGAGGQYPPRSDAHVTNPDKYTRCSCDLQRVVEDLVAVGHQTIDVDVERDPAGRVGVMNTDLEIVE